MTDAFGPWGVLPVAVPLMLFVAARLGALVWRGAPSTVSDRSVTGVLLAVAGTVLCVRLFSLVHAVSTLPLLGALAISAAVLALRAPRFAFPSVTFAEVREALPVLLVALVGLVLATIAARWLPVWQWDALGYHLPFVHFTLAAHSIAGVPSELEYVATYPHDIELCFVALRALIPDDRLVDWAQVPFGVAGAIVTAALARREGASRAVSLMAGGAWLLVPAVFLQLPTNYVDVAVASLLLAALYFALAPPSPRSILLTGVALGLFLGSKPSAPLPTCVVLAVLGVRAWRAGLRGALLAAMPLVLLFGAETYVTNVVLHDNPLWPVRIDAGPIHLPGTHALSEVLLSGANAPRLHGPLPYRFVRSLFSLTAPPVFDMRIGGFGPIVLCALPIALVELWKRRSWASWVALLATLVTPDAAVARYVLAFPPFVLAVAAPWLSARAAPVRTWVAVAFGALGALSLVYAAPGLTGDGPPLSQYASMTDAQRALAVGADGPPVAIAAARKLVGPGETFAFDENMDLSDLAWDPTGRYRVVYLTNEVAAGDVRRAIEDDRVRVMAVGDEAPAGVWASAHPGGFEKLATLSSCRRGTCSIYARR